VVVLGVIAMDLGAPKLGFSFLYFGPRLDPAGFRWFDRLAFHGYGAAELPIVGADRAQVDAARKALAAAGLKALAVGFAVPGANPVAADAAERRAAVEHLGRLAETAAALGSPMVAGPMHSAYGVWTEQPPTAGERARCVDVLRQAGDHAAKCGVTLALEPLNRFESYFLNTAADCASLVRDIGHPAVVGALDTHHAHIEEADVGAAIAAMGGTLGHVQLSENHRGTPGAGQVDFGKVAAALRGIDYRGWLVVEAFSRIDPGFGSALRIWRALDRGPEDVLAAGARLLRHWL
jgi:D-psicose/D-tagatose/L-ribulose 3-epimerase